MINPLSNPGYLVPPLVAVFITIVLALLVWGKSRRAFSNRIFCALLLSMMLYCMMTFIMRSSPDVNRAVIWDRFIPPAGFAVFVFYYHFSLVYTSNKRQRGFLLASYLVLLAVIGLIPTPLLVKNMTLAQYGYTPVPGPLAYPLTIGVLLMILAGYNIIKRYKVSRSYEERNRLIYLFIAILFPLVGGLLDGFSDLPPVAIWANLIFCIICSIAILRYHLLDIRIAIRKGFVYLIISVIVAIPYVGILYLLQYVIEPATEKWWVHSTIILVLAIILRPIYSRVQEWIDRLFYRDRYSYIKALEQFTQQVQSIENLDNLVTSLIHVIKGALRASSICLLLPSEGQQGFTLISHIGLNILPSKVVLSVSNSFIKWLNLHGEIVTSEELDFIPRLQSLSQRDKNNMKQMKTELCVPLKTRQGQLSGILILGPKLSGQLYSDAERRLLITLSTQMAMALENARLYDLEKNLRVEVQKQNEQKTEFLNQVAHEMKTPLTSLISSSELLGDTLQNIDDITKRLIGNLIRSSSIMDRRVTELLELARTQNRETKLDFTPLEISKELMEIVANLSSLFESKKQNLSIDIAESLPFVKVDRGRLEQIIYNLLSNASKFSPDNSRITLNVIQEKNSVVVKVHDNAPLITDVEKSKIFTPYYRGEDIVEQNEAPGLGLGLYITKELVEQHKGKIWVDNGANQGNIFAFSLPISS